MQTIRGEHGDTPVTHRFKRSIGGCLLRDRVREQVIRKVGKLLLPGHLMKNVQPSLFAACHHIGCQARSGKNGGK